VLIAEEVLLLCLDDLTGTYRVSVDRIDPALGAALLAELAVLGRITVTPQRADWQDRGRVTLRSAEPTGDTELDRALQSVAARDGQRATRLISSMSLRRITHGLRRRLLERLVAAGIVAPRRGRLAGVLPRALWPAADPAPQRLLRERVHRLLRDAGSPVDDRGIALVCLLYATGALAALLPPEDRASPLARAAELAETSWVAASVRQAVREVYAATMQLPRGLRRGPPAS